MTDTFRVTVDKREGLAVLRTEGYINDHGGQEIANVVFGLVGEGCRALVLNLAGTTLVNSIGISILSEVIDKMAEVSGKMGFCDLTPTLATTFDLAGLGEYARIYSNEAEAVAGLKA